MYQPKVYRKQGGNELVVASGGKVTKEAGGIVEQLEQILVHAGGGKAGATAGWVPAAGTNRTGATLPASQTNSTLVIPIPTLKVGDIITGFSLAGQIESAGATASISGDLRKLTAAAADLSDASVGAMAAPLSVTADTIISAANAVKTGLSEVVGADECFYLLITATTAAATDIDLMGAIINVTRQ